MASQSNINSSEKKNYPPIAIKTSWGKHLGIGHLQRMTSLLWYLNNIKNIAAFIITDSIPASFPAELKKYVKCNINFVPGIIIYDMRDSSKDEIASLRKRNKVITIDDNGEGRMIADYVIDMLPNPEAKARKPNLGSKNIFIYGFNFINALFKIKSKTINKNLDFVIYPGNQASSAQIDFLKSLIPLNSSYSILKDKDSYTEIDGKKKSIKGLSYAEIILSSKSLISHFGITLYEGFISGCNLFAINPTPYHSLLADMEEKKLGLINFGTNDEINQLEVSNKLKKSIENPLYKRINAGDVYKTTIDNLEDFYRLLITII